MEGMYEVDPNGDLIIVLRNPGAPFAEVVTEAEPACEESPAVTTEVPTVEGAPAEDAAPSAVDAVWFWGGAPAEEAPTEQTPVEGVAEELPDEAESVVEAELVADPDSLLGAGSREQEEGRPISEASGTQLRVSSRHLILASPYFKAALNGPWKEATSVSADGCRHIFADDWDIQAFLILMHIIHGHNRQVPRLVSLELLAKIAALVDYYECYEAVEVFAGLWLPSLKSQSQLLSQVGRDLVLWLFISWVFADADIFTSVTSIALQNSQGPLPTFGFPVPERIIEAIDRRRQEVVDKIITALQDLLVSFRDGPDNCSFECSSILLGALTKEIRAKRFEPKARTANARLQRGGNNGCCEKHSFSSVGDDAKLSLIRVPFLQSWIPRWIKVASFAGDDGRPDTG